MTMNPDGSFSISPIEGGGAGDERRMVPNPPQLGGAGLGMLGAVAQPGLFGRTLPAPLPATSGQDPMYQNAVNLARTRQAAAGMPAGGPVGPVGGGQDPALQGAVSNAQFLQERAGAQNTLQQTYNKLTGYGR